jgi:hypothetical protein
MTRPSRTLSAPPTFHYASSQNKPNDIITSSPNNESLQFNVPPDTPVSAYTSFSSPTQSIYNPRTPTRTLTPLSQEEKIPLSQEEKPKRRKINVREIPTKVTRSLSNLQQQCTRKRMIDDVKKLFGERFKILKDIEQTKELLEKVKNENKVIDKNSDDFSDSILSKLKEILEEKRNAASSPSLPPIQLVSEPEPIIHHHYHYETKNIYHPHPETRDNYEKTREIIYIYKDNDNNEKVSNKDVNNSEVKKVNKRIEEEGCEIKTREINVYKERDNNNNEEVINKTISNSEDDIESPETILTKEMNHDKSVDNPKEEEDNVKSPETILTREINEVEINLHLEEVKTDILDVNENNVIIENKSHPEDNNTEVEESEKEECRNNDENNVVIENINSSESHSEEEELKKDNNTNVEENEIEECRNNDENNVVIENINSSESHSEEEELKEDNNTDVEENEIEECRNNDENNVVIENINSSKSQDDNNINVEETEKEEFIKADDGDSVHSVSERVPEIILSHSEDSEINEINNPNIENNVTVNQINQINYNIVQNVTNMQQPQKQDDYEDSIFLKTVKKIVKEVEIIVDKAAKAHREAVLRSSANLSNVSVNEINETFEEVDEKEEIIEEIVEKEEIIEKIIEKEEIIEKVIEKEEVSL